MSTCGDALKRIRELADYRNPFPGDLPTLTHDTVLEARELVDLIEGL